MVLISKPRNFNFLILKIFVYYNIKIKDNFESNFQEFIARDILKKNNINLISFIRIPIAIDHVFYSIEINYCAIKTNFFFLSFLYHNESSSRTFLCFLASKQFQKMGFCFVL